jgi:poly-gamma-glutamate synthesis protein (capsule biosynthesis protein)
MEPTARLELAPAAGPALRLLAVGDIAFDPAGAADAAAVLTALRDVYDPDLLEVLRDKDVSLANLETVLSNSRAPLPKDGPNLWAPPAAVQALTVGGFDLAMMANNHVMDQGAEALNETLSVVRAAGLRPLGAGANLADALQPAVMTVRGVRVGFLAVADEDVLSAGETAPGAARLDLAAVVPAIEKLKPQADVIVVSVHGDKELAPTPSPRFQRLCRCLVDCGAAAVIGHHPHIIHGIEVYRGAPILYSLGNFHFPTPRSMFPPCWYEGMIARLTIADRRVAAVEVYACEQAPRGGAGGVRLMTGAAREEWRRRLERFSQVAADPALVREFWKCTCFDLRDAYLAVLKSAAAGVQPRFLRMIRGALGTRDVFYLPAVAADYLHYLLSRKTARARRVAMLRGLWASPVNRELLVTILEMEQTGQGPNPAAWAEFQAWKPYFT